MTQDRAREAAAAELININDDLPQGDPFGARLLNAGRGAEHSGDCTHESHSCLRCGYNRSLAEAGRIIDAFLTTVLEGADERVAEIRERLADDYQSIRHPDVGQRLEDAKTLLGAFAASQTHLYNAEREIADYKRTVSAFQSQLTAQKAAHAKMLRDEADGFVENAETTSGPETQRRFYSIARELRRLADKIEGTDA